MQNKKNNNNKSRILQEETLQREGYLTTEDNKHDILIS